MYTDSITAQIDTVTKIFMVTNDKFLFLGLRTIIPNLFLINMEECDSDSIDHVITTNIQDSKYAVIFDNRITLKVFNRLMSNFFCSTSCISSMLLDMQGKNCARMFIGEPPKINARTIEGIYNQVNRCLLNFSTINFRRRISTYRITPNEFQIISSMLNGKNLRDISRALTLSEKKLYTYRDRLHHRFGFSNFNEACLFIFRNEMLSDPALTQLIK